MSKQQTNDFEVVSEMDAEQGLTYIVKNSLSSAKWGKDSTLSTAIKTNADHILLIVCGMSPILLLFPEITDLNYQEITRLEWHMMWRFGQTLWVGQHLDKRTMFVEQTVWNFLLEMITGQHLIIPMQPNNPETSISISKQPKVHPKQLKEVVVGAIHQMNSLDG
ncbi:hypothetical protein BS47DRAFT_1363922 [Hydnum rufescens UP504]|uniref:Uncharacterized protein n=1 Tax=Hydnum rufescens UP504 TaxID=1448309 RepID=A0A9P6AT91_9AGAM|nr:hypothetical protein BS47DRAFT_1363922 [Hydnum rufescens UP504]